MPQANIMQKIQNGIETEKLVDIISMNLRLTIKQNIVI